MTDIRKLDSLAVSQMIDEYIELCKASRRELQLKNGDVKIRQTFPTILGLAEYMGVGFQRLYEFMDISNQKALPGSDSIVNVDVERRKAIGAEISRARALIAETWIQAAAAGDAEPRIAERILSQLTPDSTDPQAITITIQGASTAEIAAWTR